MRKKNNTFTSSMRYCSYCGSEMVKTTHFAEENKVYDYEEEDYVPSKPAFDPVTGERNYCHRYTCPQWKDSYFVFTKSQHDRYFC